MSAGKIERFQEIFICPLCKKQMQLINLQSLVCSNQHCFDIAKQGYINLLSRASNAKYDKKIFEYRRVIIKSGLFNPLHAAVSGFIMSQLQHNEPVSILDVGCGEGSHLNNIQIEITQKKPNPLLAVGMDISKEGIGFAAAGYSNAIWCVADIANCPFANQQFKFILNILSPANYSEFQRLITDNGLMIKIVPEQKYLKELRDIFYEGSDKQVYSNSLTISHFKEQFKLLDVESIRYQVNLSEALIEPLLGMTPLSWGTSEERIEKILQMNLKQITMDFKILIGKK
ncbi:putative RNA methyltransferase [Paenibacillus guangzhouensis]|uniref:putative RNA methyltransferase n=1 Tax=Paenibacillus guangzhouensis TaxID=1473112 RepID=UPI001D0F70AA|nr:methyltransferase domain-containing protein [Paenibacillus guangzhouensis]